MDNIMLVISPYIQYVRHPGMPILIDSWLVDERVTLDTHTVLSYGNAENHSMLMNYASSMEKKL